MRNLIKALTHHNGKGILASDESTKTLSGRFSEFGLETPDHETKRAYREVLYTTPGIEQYLGGIILFGDMLLECNARGDRFIEVLQSIGIVVGVTADQGRIPINSGSSERITLGLDGIESRLSEYRAAGATFCKWRCEFRLAERTPSADLMMQNIRGLVSFARACQDAELTPLVEPDLLMEGDHSLSQCNILTTQLLGQTFVEMESAKVDLSRVALKLHMVTPGTRGPAATHSEIAESTVSALEHAVPTDVPLVVFLSGGQSESATNANLSAISRSCRGRTSLPSVTFSFGRSLQRAALNAWRGRPENIELAQAAFTKSLTGASLAARGEFVG